MTSLKPTEAIHEVVFGVGDDAVRQQFIKHFGGKIAEFERIMAAAYERWKDFEAQFAKDRDSASVVWSLFVVVARMLLSMKLLMLGHVALSGAAKRQVLEALAQAFLFAKRGLPYLKQAREGRFSSNKALGIAVKRSADLNLNQDALDALVEARDFYNKLSHATILAMGDVVDLDGTGSHLGASFDEAKLPFYRDELTASLSLAKTLTNAIEGVARHMREWPEPSGTEGAACIEL